MNKGNNTSSFNWKKIVGIIVAIVVIIILILSLVSCQKKTNSDKPKERRVEDRDKKPKKKDKDKLTYAGDKLVFYRYADRNANNPVKSLPSKSSSKVEKYNTEILLNGDEEVTLEWKRDTYSEEGAKYINIKNNTIASSGQVTDIVIYKDGEEVDSIDNSEIGEYKVVYTYTNPDKVTVTKTRTVKVEDTILPEAVANGYVINGKYVVKLSDVSEELSDWQAPEYTKEFAEKQETVTITDINGLSNDVIVNYEANKPVITGTKMDTSNYIATYTFTVTDESDITEVYLSDGTVLDPTNNYQYTVYNNGSYTVYAKDALGNVGELPVSITGVQDLSLTPTEMENAVKKGTTQTSENSSTDWRGRTTTTTAYSKSITPNNTTDAGGAEIKVVAIKYVRFDTAQTGITIDSFKSNRINGKMVHTANSGFTASRVDEVTTNRNGQVIDSSSTNRYYYVYYEVEKTYPGKQPVKQSYVKLVDVN